MQLAGREFGVLGGQATSATAIPSNEPITIGNRTLPSRYFLAPLAGYTHLAFRVAVRELGGVGLATTDLVQAAQLVAGSKWALELVRTNPADWPLSVQIYGGRAEHLVAAAKWLAREGYEAIDINMGCPVAKITGQGGGARLMCDSGGAVDLVRSVVEAVDVPVTVKMRLGWDRHSLTAPLLAREFERLGVAALTVHGRTRQQGFRGSVRLEGIRAVVEAVERIPVVGNGDVRSVEDAWRMRRITGCAAVAIGRGALFDPWIFRKLELAHQTGDERADPRPTADQQVNFLCRHFQEMVAQHGEYQSCRMFRKFVAWYGARLGIPEDLEDRLRQFESIAEFEQLAEQIRRRHGTRLDPRPTAEFKLPKGPVELW